GVTSATRQYSAFDKATTVFVFVGFATPDFWLAVMLQILFGVHMGWLPISGLRLPVWEYLPFWQQQWDFASHLILPITVATFGGLAGFSRYMRQSMLEVIRQDYVQSARAKGLPESVVIGKHALRNAMLPIVTVLGLSGPALIGGAIVLVLALIAVAAPLVSPHDPHKPDVKRILEPPSMRHWLGTDQIGRDVLSRMLYGARVSLAVGFVSVGIATAIGIALGAGDGYHGGPVDGAVMRLVDLMLVFPRFFLLLAVLAFLKPSIWTIMVVIGLTGWMGVARLVRAEFLALKEREFVIW